MRVHIDPETTNEEESMRRWLGPVMGVWQQAERDDEQGENTAPGSIPGTGQSATPMRRL